MKTAHPFSIDVEIRTYIKVNRQTNWSGLVNEFLREHIGLVQGEKPDTTTKQKIAMTKARLSSLKEQDEKEEEKHRGGKITTILTEDDFKRDR